MTPIQSLRERFDADPLPQKWGAVASDLLRLSSMARPGKVDQGAFQNVLTETKLFTEWLAPQVEPKHQETILCLQRVLAGYSPESDLSIFRTDTREWSDKILDISGLAA